MAYDPDNVFARILRDEIPSDRVFEDEDFVAFRDINPQAPVHVVLVPRGEPPTSPAGLDAGHVLLVGRMVVTASRVAAELGLAADGYRLVLNCGEHGGQTVSHLHLHILGGRPLGPLG